LRRKRSRAGRMAICESSTTSSASSFRPTSNGLRRVRGCPPLCELHTNICVRKRM
jgi:hypothetical protein